MSFNRTFGSKTGGFTLPSFTNVQPTVSVSGIVSDGGNSDVSQQSPTNDQTDNIKGKMTNKNNDNRDLIDLNSSKDELLPTAENMMESLLHPKSREDKNTDIDNNKPTKTLENLLTDRKKEVIPISSNLITVESNGKGIELNEDSSDEDDDENNITEDNRKTDVVIDEKVEQSSADTDEDDEDDNITDEKKHIDDAKESELTEINKNISHEEALINETLNNENIENESNISPETIIKSNDKNSAIEKEVEDEVNKIQTNINEPSIKIKENDDNSQSPIPHLNRNNSIKDIPNPPSNLKKQQAFDFQTFLAQFKSKDCQHVHKYLKSFLDQFNQRIWTIEEQIKLLSEFQQFLFQKLIKYKPFNEIGNDEVKINNCKEGLEKLIMTKVYNSVFSPEMSFIKLTESHKHDKLMDKKYLLNTYLYDWVELKHLDLNMFIKVDSTFIKLASVELAKIDNYKSPRDKIVCILNSSKIIFGLIRQQDTQENADSFVPLLIYVLLHSKFKYLYSNLQYIERFRNPDFLIGETSYYVSTMQIACNFIINITKDQLTIDDEEYEKKMSESKKAYKELQQSNNNNNNNNVNNNDPSAVLTKSAEMVKQSLSNSINSFIQNIKSDNDENNEIESNDNSNRNIGGRNRHHHDNFEVSNEELERIKQISIQENLELEHQRTERNDIMKQLEGMFPNLDPSLIEDVLASSFGKNGYNVGECVNSLLALSE